MAHRRLALLWSHLFLLTFAAALSQAQAPRLISAASRMSHGSAAYDVALPLSGASGIECRSTAKGLTLVLDFDRTISGARADITSGTAQIDGKPTVAGNTMTIRLSAVANAQELAIAISNVAGQASGKSQPIVLKLRTLEGDLNADGTVSRLDLNSVMSRVNNPIDEFNFRADTDASGSLGPSDVNRGRTQLGRNVSGGASADTPPTVGRISNQTAYAGRASTAHGFAVSDAETPAGKLAVRATSSDPVLLPDASITIAGEGQTRTISVTPTEGRTGRATITVSVTDGLSVSTGTFDLDVSMAPTLYVARMTPQAGVQSLGSGNSTLLLSADETSATVRFNYSNLSSPVSSKHIHGPADPGQSGGVLLDLDPPFPPNVTLNADGSYTWVFVQVGNTTVAQIVDAIKTGRTYINIHSSNYPDGEIRGHYVLAAGSQTFTPPAAPPPLPGGPPTSTDAARFLTQATFGPTEQGITELQTMRFDAWLTREFNRAPTLTTPLMNERAADGETIAQTQFLETWWNRSLTAPDQLRQRVAFALSEILVVSFQDGGLQERPYAIAAYYDLLINDAFKNFRTILEDVTLNPSMGIYLDMQGNGKATSTTIPNENYARELLQLFSVGVNKLHPDGTLILDDQGLPIATYDQAVIEGLARVCTGWNYHQTGQTWPNPPQDFINPMTLVASQHETGTKQLLDGVVLPASQGGTKDLADALNQIFKHPNTGPFISKQLIQRLVTSNPSPAYVYRVAQKFANNGQGVRGDMKAVIKAILTDYEARSTTVVSNQGYGKLREPLLRATAMIRALHPTSASGYFKIPVTDVELGQSPMRAPTVFNFFEPGFVFPGVLALNGLVAPEFAISSETEVATTANFLEQGSRTFFKGNDIRLDLTTEQQLASNPLALVERLNLLLMYGSMSSTMKTRLVNHLNTILGNNSLRAQAAVHLIVTSPEFCIQR